MFAERTRDRAQHYIMQVEVRVEVRVKLEVKVELKEEVEVKVASEMEVAVVPNQVDVGLGLAAEARDREVVEEEN